MNNYKEFYEEVKKLAREKGKTNFISREEIEKLIVKYGGEENEQNSI